MLSNALDHALDFTVAPGYGSIGYSLRSRSWDPRVPAGALAGRDVLVTGASSGIGEAACRQLAQADANVHLLARNRERGEAARERVAARGGEATLHICDVADLDSVREFAPRFTADAPELAGLIHNAGVLAAERQRSPQGLELTFATAVAGPFLLTRLLERSLRAGAPSRVVFVASGGMLTAKLDAGDLQLDAQDFDGPRFYAHAKREQVVLAGLFQERHGGRGVGFHSMHPGWVDTPGLAASLPRFRSILRPILRDPEEGADTAVWLLACAEAGDHPGAFWHDRRPRSPHRLPRTRETAAERERLWVELERLTRTSTNSAGSV